jgi:hypothetical protein
MPAARRKEPLRVVIGFGLYVLRQRQRDGAAFGWVGQHAHRLRQAPDDLFRSGDPVPPSRDRPKAVIDRDGRVAERLDLLQYRVGPAPGKDVAGQQQNGQAIGVATAAAVTMFVAPGPIELVQAIMRRRPLALAKATAANAIACSLCARNVGKRSLASYSASPNPATLP